MAGQILVFQSGWMELTALAVRPQFSPVLCQSKLVLQIVTTTLWLLCPVQVRKLSILIVFMKANIIHRRRTSLH